MIDVTRKMNSLPRGQAAGGAARMKRFSMARIWVAALLTLAGGCGLRAQAVQTTVCAILKDPASFNGKIVTVKGTAVVGFDEFILKDEDCGLPVNGIWLDYPPGTKGKAGPIALLVLQPAKNFAGTYTAATRTPVTLSKDKDFKQFDSMLAQTHTKDPGTCLGCTRYAVTATVTGRLDGVADATVKRDGSGKIVALGGFGNLNGYPARLVIQQVAGVQGKEVDFSKADSVVKGEPVVFSNTFDASDPVGVAQQFANAMQKDAGAAQLQKDAAVYGKKGSNGVVVESGAINEETAAEETQGTQDSPDGVLYDCTFNIDRLLKNTQALTVYHVGQHINDLRATEANEVATVFTLENNAWVITAAGAARVGEQFLTLPGGNLFMSSTWTPAERDGKMEDALTDFLTKEMALGR
jgi:hypothetical protein